MNVDNEDTEYHKLRIAAANAIIEARRVFNEKYSNYRSSSSSSSLDPHPHDIISDVIKMISNSFIMKSSKPDVRVEGLMNDLKGEVAMALSTHEHFLKYVLILSFHSVAF